MRAALVSTEALSTFAREVGVVRFVRFGRGAASSGDAHQPKVLADIVEAIVAAVFLAQGLDAARHLTRLIVGDTVRSPLGIAERDPKSKLQEFVQRGGEQAPTYRLVDVSGPDHGHQFDVEVIVNGNVVGCGSGRTKKVAEREAARIALETLQK
jgi:ribonuclease-3